MNEYDDQPDPLVSYESEQSTLGALLHAPERMIDIELAPEDFAASVHRAIFASIQRLIRNNQPVDVISVLSDLQETGETGITLAYLGKLYSEVPNARNINRYAEVVREKALSRQMTDIGTALQAMARNPEGMSMAERLERGINLLQGITTQVRGDEPVSAAQAAMMAVDYAVERMENKGAISGIKTGLVKLDEVLNGFSAGDLIIIAGRPSMGKTALAMQGVQAACKSGKKVHVNSMEMSARKLSVRAVSSLSSLPSAAVRKGSLTKSDVDVWSQFSTEFAKWPLTIDDSGEINVDQIAARAKRQKVRHGMDLLVVDHLGLVNLPGRENRATALGNVTTRLKALAKTLDVPVVLLAQLNRESAKAGVVRRPELTDLRDSGRIEEDADVVLLLHRPGYYEPEKFNPTLAEIIVAKQRDGERGQVLEVGWNAMYTRFQEEPKQDWQPRVATYSGYSAQRDEGVI